MNSTKWFEYNPKNQKLIIHPCGVFPENAIDFARNHTVRIIEANNWWLTKLPDNFSHFQDLKALFFQNQWFEEVPWVLSNIEWARIISLKWCKGLARWPKWTLPTNSNWIVMSWTPITEIPDDIENFINLRKFALVWTLLRDLNDKLQWCSSIELLRISAWKFDIFPEWIFDLPKLAWYSDWWNPWSFNTKTIPDIPNIFINDIEILEKIWESPSSSVYKARIKSSQEEVAVKLFKWELTSDWYPEDDMKSAIASWNHNNLIKIIGNITDLIEWKKWLVLWLVWHEYKKLWNPPSLESCTRDTFDENTKFSQEFILQVLKDISNACAHLHSRWIMHWDIYAHNILSNQNWNSLLWDFWAASFYNNRNWNKQELIDVRAFWYLIEDLLLNWRDNGLSHDFVYKLIILKDLCLWDINHRIGFSAINDFLKHCF